MLPIVTLTDRRGAPPAGGASYLPAAARRPVGREDTARDAERELAARCVSGDAAAQRELFARHLARVRSICGVLGATPPLDDLVQDVFCAVFRQLRGFRAESSLATWIGRIAVRTAMKQIRRRRVRERIESGELPDLELLRLDQPCLERSALEREAARRLVRALEGLTTGQREVLTRHLLEGLSLEETAAALRCSLEATKARLWRARCELRRRAALDPCLADYVLRAGEACKAP